MINLLSPEIKEERTYGRRNVTLLGYSIILVLTAVATATIMAGGIRFVGADENKLRNEIQEAEIQISSLEASIKPIESVVTRLETAKKVSDLSVSFSELIPEIGAVLPEGVILNALSLTGGITDPLQLDVDLTSASLAPVLIRNLVESDLFEAADISSLTPKGVSVEEGAAVSSYTFNASVTASFTGSAEIQRKAKAAAAAKAEQAAQQQESTQ